MTKIKTLTIAWLFLMATIIIAADDTPNTTNQVMLSYDFYTQAPIHKAFNNSKNTDSVKTCIYNKNTICKIMIAERMPAIIKLPVNVLITDVVLGDDANFEAHILSGSINAVVIKSRVAKIDTNLNVITESGLIYTFYILSNGADAQKASHFVVNVINNNNEQSLINNNEFATNINYKQEQQAISPQQVSNESMNQFIHTNISKNSLSTTFRKILPNSWELDMDYNLQRQNYLVDVISEDKTRKQVIIDLAEKLQLQTLFYPKIKLLVVTELSNPIIK